MVMRGYSVLLLSPSFRVKAGDPMRMVVVGSFEYFLRFGSTKDGRSSKDLWWLARLYQTRRDLGLDGVHKETPTNSGARRDGCFKALNWNHRISNRSTRV